MVRDALGIPVRVVINRDGEGDDGVERYCENEQIPVLLRIPFDRGIAVALGEDGASIDLTPDDLAGRIATVAAERSAAGRAAEPYDIAVLGSSAVAGPSAGEYIAAGATWWLESLSPMRGTVDELEAVVRDGPPA